MLGLGDPLVPGNGTEEEIWEYLPPEGIGGGGNALEILEFEDNDWESKPAADIVKIFNCFDLVPSNSATTYEMTLNADIPANTDENVPVTLNGNPGHAFLTITKTNGTQSITQAFGFYPASGPKSLTLDNVSSKIVLDNNHEINASLKMNIHNVAFELIKQHAIYLATQNYNLETNNCAHFAIDLFNIPRLGMDITVPTFVTTIPGIQFTPTIVATMTKSPQALFAKLNNMKTTGHAEAANITIDRGRNYKSSTSHGECP
jgi:hypothetical protein